MPRNKPARQAAKGDYIAQALGEGARAYVIQHADLQLGDLSNDVRTLLSKALSPPPEVSDLFEIIRDPADVPPAIFRTDPGRGPAPYQVPYVTGRQGEANAQVALYEALLDSGGALLVQSRAGLGKTREVAELASRLCNDEGWTICVARGDGDAKLSAPATFPDALRGCRLLFVLDDLHRRVGTDATAQEPYIERLNAFLKFFDDRMLPGEIYVIATVRSEPHHQKQLGFDRAKPLWDRLKVFELPEFTSAGLSSMLSGLARWADVDVNEGQVEQMVSNSDRTLRTLVENVDRARRGEKRLTFDDWLPSQGKSWDARLREARGRWPDAERVYEALNLIHEAGLPTRIAYAVQLGTILAESDVAPAAEGLVNLGMIGLRSGLMDAFGDEHLKDSLRAAGGGAPELATHWRTISDIIVKQVKVHPEWLTDAVNLARNLLPARRYKEAESVATAALNIFPFHPFALLIRGVARSSMSDHAAAEQDLASAIEQRGDDVLGRLGRGLARYSQENYAGAEEDLTAAMARGEDGPSQYDLRGMARFFQDNFTGAEEDLSASIDRGQDDENVYFMRGLCRSFAEDFAGAESDYSAAIARGHDDAPVYQMLGIARVALGAHAEAEAAFGAAIDRGQDDADVYFQRGGARASMGDSTGAESDFTAAIARGQDDAFIYFFRGVTRSVLGAPAEAAADFTAAIDRGQDDADVYLQRGAARVSTDDSAGAEEDLIEAIARGADDAEVYYLRGVTRNARGAHSEAEEDFTAAIARGQDDAAVFCLRGSMRNARGAHSEAEEDFTTAIARGQDDADVYFQRGQARMRQGDVEGAEDDYDSAIAMGQDDASVFYLRGGVRIARDDPAGAEEDYTAAMAAGQVAAPLFFVRGLTRYLQSDHAGAEADFSAAIARGLDEPIAYQLRAYANIRLERLEQAQEDCQQVEARAPDDPDTHGRWGDLYLSRQQYSEAIVRYETAVRAKSDAGAYFQLGLALLLAGQLDEAKNAYNDGLAEPRPMSVIQMALRELDFWTARQGDRLASTEGQATIALLRRELSS